MKRASWGTPLKLYWAPSTPVAEIAGPGFLNLFLAPTWLHDVLRDVVAAGDRYGRSTILAGRRINLELPHGVYAGLLGPSYETPAEIRYLRTIGADAVGMSTVLEALAARHMGIEVLGISCISNMAAGVLPQPLNHLEVLETTRRIRGQFIALLEGIIGRLS